MKNNKLDRKENSQVVIIGLVIILVIYLCSASMAPYSDNVGVFVIPILFLFIHGPLISLGYASIATYLDRSYGIPTNHLMRDVLRKMPILLRFTGFLGLAFTIFVTISLGVVGLLELLFFPFWAIGTFF